MFVNVADLPDPEDSQGRTYREVNAEKTHKIPLRSLVELGGGVRLFVAMHTRDCDMTPLYSLTPELDNEYDSLHKDKWVHGYSQECLTVIKEGG